MATSGSTDFTRTRSQLIKGALRLIGVLRAGASPTTQQDTDAAEALNMMVKAWSADGLKLWVQTEATLFLVPDQQSYTFGTDHITLSSDVVATAVASDAATGASTVTVDDDTGIASGDFIGIVLDSGAWHWTTVNGAPASDVVTLTAVLPSAASDGAKVYTYTTKLGRPQRVLDARMVIDATETPLEMLARRDYFDIPTKGAASIPNQAYFDPQLTAKLYVWPTLGTLTGAENRLTLTFERLLEDFDANGDTPDLPVEWLEALKTNLAIRLAPEYGRTVPQEVLLLAAESRDRLMGWDREGSVSFQPDMEDA